MGLNMCISKLIILLLLLHLIDVNYGQICTAGDTIGEDNTQSESNNFYDFTNFNAFLINHNQFQFDCCGYISIWEIYVRNNAPVPIDVTAQVWEDTGTLWNLVDENILTATVDDAENVITVPNGQRIRVQNGYYIGYYQHAGSVITYGNGDTARRALFAGPQTTYDWDSATQDNNEDHAIHARVVPSAIPIFSNLDDTVTVQNTAVGGAVLFTLATIDTDLEDVGSLTIAVTTSSALFDYDAINMQIKVGSGVTLTPGDHPMTFSVTDVCGRSSSGTLTMRVLNTPPVITSLPASVSISEELAVETLLHTIVVVDTDAITCTLVSTGVPYLVKPIAGTTSYGVYLSNGASMDYDVQNAYDLELSCTDTYDTTFATFRVNLTRNEPPVINSLPLAQDVQEDTNVETTLYTLSVTDPENVAVTASATVTPATSILFLKPSTNFNEFEIVLASNANLNYDAIRMYRFDITSTDGRRSDSNVFFVNVLRNRPPSFVNLQNITTVSSISSYIGQIVFDVDVTDPENDQVTYSMFTVPANNAPYSIYNSGEIVLTRSIEGEFVPAYDLYVSVNDGKTIVGPRSLTVHVLDINYVPVIRNLPLPSPLVVSENSASGFSIYQVMVQDNDNADTHTYTMTSSPSDGMLYFEIDSSTGLIRTTTTSIDVESLATVDFTFTISVTDTKDSVSQILNLTIANVNEPPVFTKTSYVLTVNEGTAGTLLPDPGYLFIDDDTGDTHTFSMACTGNVGYFSIDSATGRISLATDLDVDGAGLATSYSCPVTVSDGVLTDTASVTINVNNINDNTPTFASNLYTFNLDINTAVNTVFGSTVATDGDIGAFGTFTYSVDQASLGTETFGVHANGDVYIKNSLTGYGYGQSLSFRVLATDTGSLQGSTTVFVVIPQTTTTTTTTTDRPLTFFEYSPNLAWVVVLAVLCIILLFLPCIMIYDVKGKCTYKGRPDDHIQKNKETNEMWNIRDTAHITSGNLEKPQWRIANIEKKIMRCGISVHDTTYNINEKQNYNGTAFNEAKAKSTNGAFKCRKSERSTTNPVNMNKNSKKRYKVNRTEINNANSSRNKSERRCSGKGAVSVCSRILVFLLISGEGRQNKFLRQTKFCTYNFRGARFGFVVRTFWFWVLFIQWFLAFHCFDSNAADDRVLVYVVASMILFFSASAVFLYLQKRLFHP